MPPPKKKKIITSYLREEEKIIEVGQSIKKETRQVDFKAHFDPSNIGEWCQLLKDIIAMANSGGGMIVFGVNDDGSLIEGYNNSIITNIDPAVIADKIFSYTGEHLEVKNIEINRGVPVPAFLIEEAPTPIAFLKHGADVTEGKKQKAAFTKGSVYFRHGAKSEPGTTNDIRRAFERALNRTKRSWFEGVRKISNIKDGEEVLVKRVSAEPEKILQTVPGRIVADSSAPGFRLDNAATIWPYRRKNITQKLKALLPEEHIIANGIQYLKKQHNINHDTKPEFVFHPYKEDSPRYSESFVEWIIENISKNPQFIEQARIHNKEIRKK